jgi:hypothetical protein
MCHARAVFLRASAAVLLPLGVLGAAGCRSEAPSYRLKGKVLYLLTDKPCTQDWVCLECTEPPYARPKAPLSANVEFTREAPAGEHRMCLEAGEVGATRAGMAAYLKQVDQKYVVFATSEWKVTVAPRQENHVTLYVTMPGGK